VAMIPERRLHRSRRDRQLAGVCGGLGEYFEIDSVIWRLGFVAAGFVTAGAAFLVYVVLAVLMPQEEQEGQEVAPFRVNPPEDVNDPAASPRTFDDDLPGYSPSEATLERQERRNRNRQLGGLIMVGAGALLLLGNLNVFWWFNWARFWPVVLIIVGVAILAGQRRR
jgi:phage shock protein C